MQSIKKKKSKKKEGIRRRRLICAWPLALSVINPPKRAGSYAAFVPGRGAHTHTHMVRGNTCEARSSNLLGQSQFVWNKASWSFIRSLWSVRRSNQSENFINKFSIWHLTSLPFFSYMVTMLSYHCCLCIYQSLLIRFTTAWKILHHCWNWHRCVINLPVNCNCFNQMNEKK